MTSGKKAIVIGAGIVGLAVARALAIKGYRVKVIDRSAKAVGASVRNFGMVWPIGQPTGEMFEIARRSRDIWKEIGDAGAFWYDPVGSLHVAHENDEWTVLQEVFEKFRTERRVQLMDVEEVTQKSNVVSSQNLKGGLYSAEEIIVDPRKAMSALPGYLSEKYDISFLWKTSVNLVSGTEVETGSRKRLNADIIFLCTGAEVETLFPELFPAHHLTKCQLQMMRLSVPQNNSRIGPAICGGLSLIHYNSFKIASSLKLLKERLSDEMKEYLEWGIHVMASQNEQGDITIGDSHEYGDVFEPFNKSFINALILSYLNRFANFRNHEVIEYWSGTYLKDTNGAPYYYHAIDPHVHILNALGGAGMTLSFGLAEKVVAKL